MTRRWPPPPSTSAAWLNRGLALAALNRYEEALSSYAQARALDPENADAHFNAALSLLTIGDYRRGFAEYEWRWKRSGMGKPQAFGKPLWLGDVPLAGKTILLHAEQGLGDTVQFARYAPALARDGAKVILEVPAELKTLLAGVSRCRHGCNARRVAAAVRPALSVGEPAAGLQDRDGQHPGRHSLSAGRRNARWRIGGRGLNGVARRVSRWPGRGGPRIPTIAIARLCLSQLEPLLSVAGVMLHQHPARAACRRRRHAGAGQPHRARRR